MLGFIDELDKKSKCRLQILASEDLLYIVKLALKTKKSLEIRKSFFSKISAVFQSIRIFFRFAIKEKKWILGLDRIAGQHAHKHFNRLITSEEIRPSLDISSYVKNNELASKIRITNTCLRTVVFNKVVEEIDVLVVLGGGKATESAMSRAATMYRKIVIPFAEHGGVAKGYVGKSGYRENIYLHREVFDVHQGELNVEDKATQTIFLERLNSVFLAQEIQILRKLQKYPISPRVDSIKIPTNIYDELRELFSSYDNAKHKVEKSIQEYLATVTKKEQNKSTTQRVKNNIMDIPEQDSLVIYWSKVFKEACIEGPRLVASLLLIDVDGDKLTNKNTYYRLLSDLRDIEHT